MRDCVAIVGCGLVGRAWAICFARGGYQVALWDSAPRAVSAALAFVEQALPELESLGLLDGASAAVVRARVAPAESLAQALAGARHVQESTPEAVETKRAVFAELDRLTPEDVVLASSTSALLPSSFTEGLAGRHRCLVAHPINPPYLVPAVEVVPAPWTDAAVCERTRSLLQGVGQAPIVMQREIDGFVMNRLQGALLQEAFRLVGEGYASAEDVDIGVRDGLGLRWSFMGPFETIDLNAPGGVADYVARYEALYRRLWETQQHRVPWAGPLTERIESERDALLARSRLAQRQLWRDRRLMALAAHKRAAMRSGDAAGGDPKSSHTDDTHDIHD